MREQYPPGIRIWLMQMNDLKGKTIFVFGIAFLCRLWHCVVLEEVNRMELWKESLQTALDERLDVALMELAESNTDIGEAVKQQRDVSMLVKDHPKYDDEMKQAVDAYFEAMQLLLGEYSHHLYIQGAKDCVEVLRELGVIK